MLEIRLVVVSALHHNNDDVKTEVGADLHFIDIHGHCFGEIPDFAFAHTGARVYVVGMTGFYFNKDESTAV